MDEPECIQRHDGTCHGAVEHRPSLTGTGTRIPRCEHHWERRLQAEEEHRQIYPDSDIPPAWFDPAAAGERWNEDD